MKSARATKVKSSVKKAPKASAKKPAAAKKTSLAKKVMGKVKGLISKADAKKAAKEAKKAKELAAKEKALKAKEQAKAKAEAEAKKKILVNPWEPFTASWKPKSETFEVGLEKFCNENSIKDEDGGETKRAIADKLLSHMRKETISPDMEALLSERFPKDRVHKMATIFGMKPKTIVRVNTLKADINGFSQSLAVQQLKIRRSPVAPWAFEVGKPEESYSHPAYTRGLIDFQDEASQVLALLTNARAGQRILSLNCGTGDAALAISSIMRNKGSIFLYDSDPRKIKTFKERADRAGVDNFRILTDSQIGEVKSLDAVLIEAPSSGTGDLAAHPDLKWRFHKEDLPKLQKVQSALLREAGRKLKLGGYMVYATKTLSRSENEDQIDHFLKTSHNSYRLVPAIQYFKDFVVPFVANFYNFQWDEKAISSFAEFDPFFTMLPDVHGTPGIFVAIIQRTRISS